jgi:lipopolysaccharide/colanic/teichoic acid biosynthesis glycosyltransferase
MTGLAQVSGHRGETSTPGSIEARVNADMDYIRTWTPWLDLKILINTVRIVISGNNAG